MIMFLMVFGIAIRFFELAAAFWIVASADECKGWKSLCFPCVSAMLDEPDRDWSQDKMRHESEAPHPSQTSQKFAPGRPLTHRLYGDGWAVGRVDQTFLVCFPDGSSARYEMSLQPPSDNVLLLSAREIAPRSGPEPTSAHVQLHRG
jgi:hypothetical protein